VFPGGAAADHQIKTLVYVLDEKLTLVLLRGDHPLNETKLTDAIGAINIRPGHPEEIREALGALPGSLGAVGVSAATHKRVHQVIADNSLRGRTNMTTGANRDDFHLRGVSVDRDIKVDKWADLRSVQAGEGCSKCDGVLEVFKAVEIGHIFKLGTRYSETMGVRVLNADGHEVPVIMGSYGIGVERILAAAVELYHDEAGIIWPVQIAPFHAVVTPVNTKDSGLVAASEEVYKQLSDAGIEVLLDDRDERAGVKFNDADLIGLPYRITVGKKVKDGNVELTTRAGRKSEDVAVSQIRDVLVNKLTAAN
jgi:prolyl-tRNA synthetase